jgi:hypothetical protein
MVETRISILLKFFFFLLVSMCILRGVNPRLLHGYPWVPPEEGGPDPWVLVGTQKL